MREQPAPAHALGITEDGAQLLWPPGTGAAGPPQLVAARAALASLHPAYVRLLIDWAALQPSRSVPPALQAAQGGCARMTAPCVPYDGLASQLAAIAAQQRAARGDGWRVVVQLYGTPGWAARAPSGCEGAATPAFARAPRPDALGAYRALIASLLALAARKGVALEWWSPWNEPNDPKFLSPQRARCDASAPPVSAAAYAAIARAAQAQLAAAPGTHRLLLGELSDFAIDTPRTSSIASFVAALPQPLVCAAGAFSVHEYATHPPAPPGPDAVGALESALDRRGPCGSAAKVWVTEAGAGAPQPGRARTGEAGEERAGCEALATQLARWRADPRVAAVLQYSFREDPAFPVGLIDAPLRHLYRSYSLWSAYARLAPGAPAPAAQAACA